MRPPFVSALLAAFLLASTPVPAGAHACPTPSCSMAVAATRDGQLVVLDARSGGTYRHLDLLPYVPGTEPPVQSVSLTPDGAWVYYSAVSRTGAHEIYRVPIAGGGRQVVAQGGLVDVSPDGRHLAYTTYGGRFDDASNTIVVRDLATGDERVFAFDEDDVGGAMGRFTALSWAPDSQRLAFAVYHEQNRVSVLDTARAASLGDAEAVGPFASPSWYPDGQLVVVDPAAAGYRQVVRLGLAGGRFDPAARTPVDTSGGLVFDPVERLDVNDHNALLVVRSGTGGLQRVTADGAIRSLGSGYAVAAW